MMDKQKTVAEQELLMLLSQLCPVAIISLMRKRIANKLGAFRK
jgi:hypothetical protein